MHRAGNTADARMGLCGLPAAVLEAIGEAMVDVVDDSLDGFEGTAL